jgi:hypothetical protein
LIEERRRQGIVVRTKANPDDRNMRHSRHGCQALRGRDFNGVVVRELLGERDLSQAKATRILGARIGKPDLRYMQFPYTDFVAALFGMVISQNVAELYAEMSHAFNEGEDQVTRREDALKHHNNPFRRLCRRVVQSLEAA